jgi:endonuclease YncB( thermonuclease family)
MNIKKIARFFLLLFGLMMLMAGVLRPVCQAKKANGDDGMEKVVRVIDGDTVVISDGRAVRYLGVDTPEIDEPFYREATSLNRKLVLGKTVKVAYCKARPVDPHGRMLATVFHGDVDVSKRLLEAGLAEVFDDRKCDSGRSPLLWGAMKTAFDKGRGMWAGNDRAPILAEKAIDRVGKVAYITGTVTDLARTKDLWYANFGDWKTTGFSIRFPTDALSRFKAPEIEGIAGKKATVFGRVHKRKHGPFVVCYSPAQVEIQKQQ